MIRYFWTFLITALALMLFSCSNKNDDLNGQKKNNRKKITLIHYFSGNLTGGIQDMIKRFNEQNHEYELSVTAIDHEAFKSSIVESLEKDNPPDLYSYWAGARVYSVVDKLAPIDKIWNEAGLSNIFSSAVVNSACTYNGKKYFVPLVQGFVGFFYNKKVFEKAMLEPPKTWVEFINICSVLKKQGITPIALGAKNKWPAQFWFDYLLLRTAPSEYRDQLMNGKAHYTDQAVVNVFKIWSELLAKGFFNNNPNETNWDTDAAEAVYNGNAGMTLMGTWLTGYYSDEKHNWQADKDYGFFAFPEIDRSIPLAALGPIDGFVIPAKSANTDGAMQVLVYLSSAESQKIMSKATGSFAPNIHVTKDFYSPLQQKISNDIDKCSNWNFNYDLATPPAAAEIGLNAFGEFLEFPAYYESILKKIDKQIQSTFTK